MFDLINRNAEFIVNSIPLDHLADYDWLQLGTTFYDAYFEMLGRPYGSSPSLQEVCRSLYDASTRRNGTKVLQFSFATKLLHMRDQRLPIYDSMVTKFFSLNLPIRTRNLVGALRH